MLKLHIQMKDSVSAQESKKSLIQQQFKYEYETIKKNTEKLIKVIKDVGLNVTIKKTQISFANPKHKTKARVIYLNNYAQTKKSFHLSFAGTKTHDFFKKLNFTVLNISIKNIPKKNFIKFIFKHGKKD